ncbi:MAG TPA: transcriptional regulator, partial [Novosphingobium sp.]|nr:transcriptional regulator [Novosphingobium sp.]
IAAHGEGTKRMRHPEIGPIELEFSTFAVEGRSDLHLMVYNPATPEGAKQIQWLIANRRP